VRFKEAPSNPKIVQLSHNAQLSMLNDVWVPSTLAGISQAAGYEHTSYVGLLPPTTSGDTPTLSLQGGKLAFDHFSNWNEWHSLEACAPSFTDPRDSAMAYINELMFRTGAYVAAEYNETYLRPLLDDGLEMYHNSTAQPGSMVNVFHTNFAYFAGAAVVEVLCIVVILSTFFGFWRLDRRQMSLSPIEIANAFDSPILAEVHSDVRGSDIARDYGSREVRYGVSISQNEKEILVNRRKILVDDSYKVGSIITDKTLLSSIFKHARLLRGLAVEGLRAVRLRSAKGFGR
jgi:hypothetical protein